MKRSFVNVGLLGALGLSLLNPGAIAETKPKHQKIVTGDSKPVGRVKVSKVSVETLPKRYQEIMDVLGEKEGSKPVVKFCGTGFIQDAEAAEELKAAVEAIKEYRAQLETCSDEVSKTFKKFLDDSIDKITIKSRGADAASLKEVTGKVKDLEGLDSSLRFHKSIREFLAKKEKDLSKFEDKFLEADQNLKKALDKLFQACNAKEFQPSTDDKTTFQIDQFEQKLASTSLKEENACDLSGEGEPAPSTEENESDTSEKPDREVAPPGGDGDSETGTDSEDSGTDGGAGGTNGGSGNVLDLPGVSSGGLGGAVNGAGVFPGAGINQGVDPALAFNGLARDEDLLNRLLADFTRPNESRVGGSPDNGRSFQAPPISISPQPGNQQQQPQPQQNPYAQQPIPPFNPAAMMQPPAPIILPPEAYGARRDDGANRINPNQAAQVAAQMEVAKMQQQLLQAQMANQMAMANQQLGSGVNNSNRARRGRAAFRGARGNLASRMINRGSRRVSSTARALR